MPKHYLFSQNFYQINQKVMLKFSLFFIFLLCFSFRLQAQVPIMSEYADSLVKKGSYYIYNVQFDSAEVQFKKVIERYPDHPVGYFLNAMVDYWKLTIYRTSNIWDKSYLQKINIVIEKCDQILKDNPADIVALFFKGSALGYRGRYYVNKKEYLKAADDGKNGYEILMETHINAPGNRDLMLGAGVYNYFVEAIPDQYPFLKPVVLLFPPGNKRLGILQLRSAATHARYANVEAKVTLFQIYYMFEKDMHESQALIEDLHNSYPNNPYFHRYLGRVYMAKGYWDDIERVWRDIVKRSLSRMEGYDNMTAREGLYYVGMALMRKGDFDMAEKYFVKCDEVSEYIEDDDSGYRTGANLKLAEIYESRKDIKKAKERYKKLLKFKDFDKAHQTAKSALSRLK